MRSPGIGTDLSVSLSLLARSVQHFPSAVLDGWRKCVSAELCGIKGFRGGPPPRLACYVTP